MKAGVEQRATEPAARPRWIDEEGADARRLSRRIERLVGAVVDAVAQAS
jgi:hypothetical protein